MSSNYLRYVWFSAFYSNCSWSPFVCLSNFLSFTEVKFFLHLIEKSVASCVGVRVYACMQQILTLALTFELLDLEL